MLFILYTIYHMTTTTITQEVMPIEAWKYVKYQEIREKYENYLLEYWYKEHEVGSMVKWRDRFCKSEYQIYIENTTTVAPALYAIRKNAFVKFATEYADEARDIMQDLSHNTQ